ncbi:Ras-related protein RABH1b [Zea mays]|uniref:Ras-related protein RABH1b n=1 Tax=Zea mays TaxID=4577 RepID=A0A1D6J0G6_MAIZE|nr:Ras-related protein RABH1b [Zea mays]
MEATHMDTFQFITRMSRCF